MANLAARLKDLGAGMLVIDHFSQVLGDADENTSSVARVMSALRNLAENLNLALVLVHHVVKGVSRFGISSSESLRGHGSILASCDLAAVVERQQLDPLGVNIKPVACRGPNVEAFGAKFSYEPKKDGSLELESARFWGITTESVELQVERAILDVIGENSGINQTLLRGLVNQRVLGAGDPTIRQVVARLEKNGLIRVRSGKQNSKLYDLVEGANG
jgi:hypothetical protein